MWAWIQFFAMATGFLCWGLTLFWVILHAVMTIRDMAEEKFYRERQRVNQHFRDWEKGNGS